MPAPRLPRQKAAVAASDIKDPQRFRDRSEPAAAPLGDPPPWMDAGQKAAWTTLASEIPWLNSSHRALLVIATSVYARLMVGDMPGVQALNLLRQCLAQMGATPADASKINVPADKEVDPDEQFFGRPN